MKERWIGTLIRKNRLELGWSQEGLCRGICAVSYLSKIEQGKADCSPELRRLLMQRLQQDWTEDEDGSLHICVEALWNAVLSMDQFVYGRALELFRARYPLLLHSPYMVDAVLLQSWETHTLDPILKELPLNHRQRTLYLLLLGQNEEAVQMDPSAFTCCVTGITYYTQGKYAAAIEYLQRGYDKAAQEGFVHIMLKCRTFLGNCCSNLLDFAQMERHYQIAERIAAAVSDCEILQNIRYNRAATALELGRAKEAKDILSELTEPSALTLHKLAICYEKLGCRQEALQCLDAAVEAKTDMMSREEIRELCSVVRYRLEHPDFLRREEYGEMLLKLFSMLRASLPHGYAAFHFPYVLEWYKANRQYKQALELTADFPSQFKYC